MNIPLSHNMVHLHGAFSLVTPNYFSKQFILHLHAVEKMLCRRHGVRQVSCWTSEVNIWASNIIFKLYLHLFFLNNWGHNYVHFISILYCAETQDKCMLQHLKKLSSSLKRSILGCLFVFTKMSQTKSHLEEKLADWRKAIPIALVLLFEKYWGLEGIVLLPINEKTEGTRQNKVMYEWI